MVRVRWQDVPSLGFDDDNEWYKAHPKELVGYSTICGADNNQAFTDKVAKLFVDAGATEIYVGMYEDQIAAIIAKVPEKIAKKIERLVEKNDGSLTADVDGEWAYFESE